MLVLLGMVCDGDGIVVFGGVCCCLLVLAMLVDAEDGVAAAVVCECWLMLVMEMALLLLLFVSVG